METGGVTLITSPWRLSARNPGSKESLRTSTPPKQLRGARQSMNGLHSWTTTEVRRLLLLLLGRQATGREIVETVIYCRPYIIIYKYMSDIISTHLTLAAAVVAR